MTFDFWVKAGNVCKDIIIPILLVITVIRINTYITYKSRLTARCIKFIDGFVKGFVDNLKTTNPSEKIINFKNNDSGGGEE